MDKFKAKIRIITNKAVIVTIAIGGTIGAIVTTISDIKEVIETIEVNIHFYFF